MFPDEVQTGINRSNDKTEHRYDNIKYHQTFLLAMNNTGQQSSYIAKRQFYRQLLQMNLVVAAISHGLFAACSTVCS